jgi:ribose transport system permease protein
MVGNAREGDNHRRGIGYAWHSEFVQEEAIVKRISISPPVAALVLAITLFLLSGLLPNGFGSDLDVARAQALNILRLSVFLGVIAAGQTLVIISGSEGIDLSAGSVVTLTAILTYILVNGANEKVLLALLVVLAVGALIGLINGVGITYLKISPFVMTLGMAGVVTGAIIVITHGSVTGKVAPIMTRLIARPLSPSLPIPNAIILWVLFGILMWLLLERTTFGRNLFAIGVNRITAKLSGVNVTRMNLLTYSLAGALAGFGGFLLVGNTGVVHLQLGQPFLFPSIAAVAVGGTLLSGGKGSYWGTMAGAIVLTLITSLLTTMQMPESVRRMVLGGTLLILISIYGRQRSLRQ